MKLNSVTLIESQHDFSKFIGKLEKSAHVAVDTESNSFYAYFNRICLIQLSTEEQDFIIDPFSVGDIKALGEIFASPIHRVTGPRPACVPDRSQRPRHFTAHSF